MPSGAFWLAIGVRGRGADEFLARRTFHPFIKDPTVRLIGVEAAGDGALTFAFVPVLADADSQVSRPLATLRPSPAALPGSSTACGPTSSKPTTDRSRARTPSRPASTTPASDPSTRGSRTLDGPST